MTVLQVMKNMYKLIRLWKYVHYRICVKKSQMNFLYDQFLNESLLLRVIIRFCYSARNTPNHMYNYIIPSQNVHSFKIYMPNSSGCYPCFLFACPSQTLIFYLVLQLNIYMCVYFLEGKGFIFLPYNSAYCLVYRFSVNLCWVQEWTYNKK